MRWMPAAVTGGRGHAVRAGTGAPRGRHGPPGSPPSANFRSTASDPRRSPSAAFVADNANDHTLWWLLASTATNRGVVEHDDAARAQDRDGWRAGAGRRC